MHQGLSILNPKVQGALSHDPRTDDIDHHENRNYESEENLFLDPQEHPNLHSLLKEAEGSPHVVASPHHEQAAP